MYCNECGKKIPDDSKFCTYCGCKLQLPASDEGEENVEESGCRDLMVIDGAEAVDGTDEVMLPDTYGTEKQKSNLVLSIVGLALASGGGLVSLAGFIISIVARKKALLNTKGDLARGENRVALILADIGIPLGIVNAVATVVILFFLSNTIFTAIGALFFVIFSALIRNTGSAVLLAF